MVAVSLLSLLLLPFFQNTNIFLFKSNITTDPLISIDPNIWFVNHYANYLINNNISFIFGNGNTSYILRKENKAPEGYESRPITEVFKTNLMIYRIQQFSMVFLSLINIKSIIFSFIIIVILVFLNARRIVRSIAPLYDKYQFHITKNFNKVKEFAKNKTGFALDELGIKSATSKCCTEYFVKLKRGHGYLSSLDLITFKVGDTYFYCFGESTNVDDAKLNISCTAKTQKGIVKDAKVMYVSPKNSYPIQSSFMGDNNLSITVYYPPIVMAPFICGGNFFSIISSIYSNITQLFKNSTDTTFDFDGFIRKYCKILGISRCVMFTGNSHFHLNYQADDVVKIPLEQIKEKTKDLNFEMEYIDNLFDQNLTNLCNKVVNQSSTVYSIISFTKDKSHEIFEKHLIPFFMTCCGLIFEMAHVKEQDIQFSRFIKLLYSSTVYSLYEFSVDPYRLRTSSSPTKDGKTQRFDLLVDSIERIRSSSDLSQAFQTDDYEPKLYKDFFEDDDGHLFTLILYPHVDRISGELLYSILLHETTHLKKQEIELEESIADVQLSSKVLGLCKFKIDGHNLVSCDGKLSTVLGYPEKELHLEYVVHPQDARLLDQISRQMVTVRLLDSKGHYKWFSVFAGGAVGFAFNVNDSVETRDKINIAGKGLQLASVASSLVFWSVNLDDDSVHSLMQQPTIWEVLSVDSKTKFSKFKDFVFAEDRQKFLDAFQELQDGKISQWNNEIRILKLNKYEWIRLAFVRSKENNVQFCAANINKQKEATIILSEASKIRDLLFSMGKLTVWKFYDDEEPVRDVFQLKPGIGSIVRINRTFIDECMPAEVGEAFMQKVTEEYMTGEGFELRVNEDDMFYSIRGRLQPSTGQIVGVCIDVTDVEKATIELENQRAIAVAADQAKTAFLANMSHEIRTPMNGIFGLLDLLAQSDITTEQRLLVDTMRSSSFQLLKLLDDTLNMSKMEGKKIEYNPSNFDFWLAMEPIVLGSASRCRIAGIDFFLDVNGSFPTKAYGDPSILIQIVNNLLSNSLKFTKNGFIRLIFSYEEKEKDEAGVLGIVVSDTGIGMSKDQQKVIFERFMQSDASVQRNFGGTGLGLSLVQELVHFLNGELTLESQPGQGSTFTISIPIESRMYEMLPKYTRGIGATHHILVYSEDSRTLLSISTWMAPLNLVELGFSTTDDIAHAVSTYTVEGIIIDRNEALVDECLKITREMNPQIFVCSINVAEESSNADFRIVPPMMPHRLYQFLHSTRYGRKAAGDDKSNEADVKTVRVLVVEDNKANRFVMSKILNNIGCRFEMAVDGQNAIDILDEDSEGFDLIFMDCQMPVLDGIEATKRIRASGKPYSNVKIVALTASAVEGDAEKCLSAGMDSYMSKPVRLQQIKNVVTNIK